MSSDSIIFVVIVWGFGNLVLTTLYGERILRILEKMGGK